MQTDTVPNSSIVKKAEDLRHSWQRCLWNGREEELETSKTFIVSVHFLCVLFLY